MNIYDLLARGVDLFNTNFLLLVFIWFIVPRKRFPRLFNIHSALVTTIAVLIIPFGMRYPPTLLSGYLREISHRGFTDGEMYNPLFVTMMEKYLGFNNQGILLAIVGIMAVTFVMFVSIGKREVNMVTA